MTVIVVASHKGGVGKTTISGLLAEHFAHLGWKVAVVESDKEAHIATYLRKRVENGKTANFALHTSEMPNTLGPIIKAADDDSDITFVDMPGYDGQEFTRAAARANMILFAMAPGTMDHNSAVSAIRKLHVEEEHLGRKIPFRIVLNMVKNAQQGARAVALDRSEKELRKYFTEQQYPILKSELTERKGVFRAAFDFGETLQEMAASNPRAGVENAYTEICNLAEEIVAFIRGKEEAV